jgi:primosomal protein N' (replication factor Y)
MVAPYVEVAVGLPVHGTYHYAVPESLGLAACVGARVLVPFGTRGVTGVIVRHSDRLPGDLDEARAVTSILDDLPPLDAKLVDLCLWIADYYEAPPGEVLRAALPAGTQVASALRLEITDRGRATLEGHALTGISTRARKLLTVIAAGKPLPRGSEVVRAELAAAGLIEVGQARRAARVKKKTLPTVRLLRAPTEDGQKKISRAPRRAAVLAQLGDQWIDLKELGDGAAAAVKALVELGIVEKGTRDALRDPWQGLVSAPAAPLPPTEGQAAALTAIGAAIEAGGFASFLLHGVTGSGKTEVYLQAIAGALGRGKSAIVLVPEIALTPQLAARFRARFGGEVAVLHSGLTDGERFDEWRRLRAGTARIALGARSAIFAPVTDLGIVVVDEEHDPSFKQEEGVRYHARDVALVRAHRAGAICVLGSATPSLESYANAIGAEAKHTLLALPARATARPLPEVQLVDLRQWRADAESMVTAPLATAIDETLAAGEQAILFLNRRGFATFVVCAGCGHAFRCPMCSVSLTYHRVGDRLRCHYCNHNEPVPLSCPKCEDTQSIRRLGLGTERIEAAIAARWPKAKVGRLDRDTASGKGLRQVLDRVASRDIDILVGTQMVTKGHDFPGVTLVGVLCADTGLSLPDFRASERTFQLLTQVAGRAGRGDRPGRVIVQTYQPDHPAITCAQTHDYQEFFGIETALRRELSYPPHGRLVAVRIDGPDPNEVRAVADELAKRAEELARSRPTVGVMGPAEAPLARLKGRSRWHVWVKSVERGSLRSFVRRLVANVARGQVRLSIDVDPISAL